ncbi:MAG: long-chain fatty acid transport protein [Alteromonas macleodii]|jgi:long-chain fatty acid transport protein
MKKLTTTGAILLITTTMASAGRLDRSGQNIGAIFEEGNYAELNFGNVSPNVSGIGFATGFGGTGAATGNITPSYTQLGMAYKTQVTEEVSLALIYDQPFGANVDYVTPGYVVTTSGATVESDGLTALVRYKINPNFSVHGGLRYVQVDGFYSFNLATYKSTYSNDGGFGYVVGSAYERDEIAMRVALTYSSEIDLSLDGNVGGNTLKTTLPESINIDVQTGIAADTLLFGSIRYVDWDGFMLVDSNNPTGVGNILTYTDNQYTYNIGIGRNITEAFSASFSVGYENSNNETTSNLGPTDGIISYQVGAAYTLDSGIKISGGIRYIDLGDATTDAPVRGDFADNEAIAVGLKLAYNY